jgi:hypothetical protein
MHGVAGRIVRGGIAVRCKGVWIRVATVCLTLAAVSACGKSMGGDEDSDADDDTSTDTSTSTSTSTSTESGTSTAGGGAIDPRCQAPSADAAISSYDDFVTHFAALTEAVGTVDAACLIASLPRPLRVNATASDLSVQPATGRDNPRVFVVVGTSDVVVLGFGLAGKAAETIELSVLAPGDSATSVKGEITLPVTKAFAATAPFAQAAATVGTGSTCGACHGSETAAPERFGEEARTSVALRPMAHQDVSISALKTLRTNACKTGPSVRCSTLEALFLGESPDAYAFPEQMKTIF